MDEEVAKVRKALWDYFQSEDAPYTYNGNEAIGEIGVDGDLDLAALATWIVERTRS